MAGQWDIFCAVVDNYGDIGVTLRLARQLVAEQGVAVRLWVDDLRALQPLSPATSLTAAQQWLEGVEVRAWTAEALSGVVPGEVVIETFACELPASFIAAMAALPRAPSRLSPVNDPAAAGGTAVTPAVSFTLFGQLADALFAADFE